MGEQYAFFAKWTSTGDSLQDLIEESGQLITLGGDYETAGMEFVDCIRSTVTKILRSDAKRFTINAYDIREVLKWIEKYGGTIDYDMDGVL